MDICRCFILFLSVLSSILCPSLPERLPVHRAPPCALGYFTFFYFHSCRHEILSPDAFLLTPFIYFISMKGHVVIFRHLSFCSPPRYKSLTILLSYCPLLIRSSTSFKFVILLVFWFSLQCYNILVLNY